RMIVALLIGALLLGEPRKQASSAIGDGAGAILSALLLAAVAFAGHASAADGPAFVLQVCVDALHLLATGLWLGGLAPLLLLLRQGRQSRAAGAARVSATAARRFSNLALASVALLIARRSSAPPTANGCSSSSRYFCRCFSWARSTGRGSKPSRRKAGYRCSRVMCGSKFCSAWPFSSSSASWASRRRRATCSPTGRFLFAGTGAFSRKRPGRARNSTGA